MCIAFTVNAIGRPQPVLHIRPVRLPTTDSRLCDSNSRSWRPNATRSLVSFVPLALSIYESWALGFRLPSSCGHDIRYIQYPIPPILTSHSQSHLIARLQHDRQRAAYCHTALLCQYMKAPSAGRWTAAPSQALMLFPLAGVSEEGICMRVPFYHLPGFYSTLVLRLELPHFYLRT